MKKGWSLGPPLRCCVQMSDSVDQDCKRCDKAQNQHHVQQKHDDAHHSWPMAKRDDCQNQPDDRADDHCAQELVGEVKDRGTDNAQQKPPSNLSFCHLDLTLSDWISRGMEATAVRRFCLRSATQRRRKKSSKQMAAM